MENFTLFCSSFYPLLLRIVPDVQQVLLLLVTSVVSDSVLPHRRKPTRLPRPWDSPGKNTGVGCHFLLHCLKVKSEREVAQSCPTLSNPMDCSPPDSSVYGIFQARVLEWGAIAFSDSSYQKLFIESVCECMCVCQSFSHIQLFVTPWTIACQALLSNQSFQLYVRYLPFNTSTRCRDTLDTTTQQES